MRHWSRTIAVAAATTLAIAARADEKPARLAAITLENDFFAGYDHHYTNGVQAAFVVSPSTVFAIGQRLYTPTNTDARVPDPADRPYAGWLYAMTDTRLPTPAPSITSRSPSASWVRTRLASRRRTLCTGPWARTRRTAGIRSSAAR